MAGVYIHIPFCGHACTYCDFYFTTHLHFKESFLRALSIEIDQRNQEFNETIETIYFGGGTPSQLSASEIESILDHIYSNFSVDEHVEITLEANPDDLSFDKLIEFKKVGINRLSLGTQSFQESELKILGRVHSSDKAIKSIRSIREAGFENFSLDLIYGIPESSINSWKTNLDTLIDLSPNHVSAYCLTIEEGTPLAHQVKKGRVKYPTEEFILDQFGLLMEHMEKHNYEHYEISNFCKPNKHSKHNTSYWFGKPYIGFGPSAHSYSGDLRRVNIANTPKYVDAISNGKEFHESERLNQFDHFNEFVMTRLRTQWGIRKSEILRQFNSIFWEELMVNLKPYLDNKSVELKSETVYLTTKGKYIADKIASDCFHVV